MILFFFFCFSADSSCSKYYTTNLTNIETDFGSQETFYKIAQGIAKNIQANLNDHDLEVRFVIFYIYTNILSPFFCSIFCYVFYLALHTFCFQDNNLKFRAVWTLISSYHLHWTVVSLIFEKLFEFATGLTPCLDQVRFLRLN